MEDRMEETGIENREIQTQRRQERGKQGKQRKESS